MDRMERLAALLLELVQIPAPSNHEEKRSVYLKAYLEEMGYGAKIDSVGNVVCPMTVDDGGYTVVMAHIDTVFPDDKISAVREGNILHAPGVGDDTANVVLLLEAMRVIRDTARRVKKNLLFVFNVCEEGLGNLKGVQQIMADYAGKVDELISLDGSAGSLVDGAVGSKRYRVEVTTAGGHSYGAFGNQNAIAAAAKIISRIYEGEMPSEADGKRVYTTYNVGTIEGGTSVNTIAQGCSFMAEVRSDSEKALRDADAWLRGCFESVIAEGDAKTAVAVQVTLLGDRPSMGDVPADKMDELVRKAKKAIISQVGKEPEGVSASTDCNIPLSMGIPAVCFGGYVGRGAHTREEWVDVSSLPGGADMLMVFLGHYLD